MAMAWVLVLVALLTALYLGYQWALPKPLAGIPYDRDAARSLRGNLPEIMEFTKAHGRLRPWFMTQLYKHNAAMVQFWLLPLSKPCVILADYQEIQDILLRRTKEFDRGQRGADIFHAVVPEHHIAMTSSDPRFKGNKELVKDLMTPSFLNEVSAPEIYAKTMRLVDLWTLKASIADGKPFDAHRDIVDAAMDIINAAAFSTDDSMSTTKHQIDFLSSEGARVTELPDGSMQFPRAADIEGVAALAAVADYLGTQFKAVMPRLEHRVRMLTNPNLRLMFSRRDEVLIKETKKSLARFEHGDRTTSSALDHLLQREISASTKAGRKPDFFSTRIRDEIYGYVVAGHETSSTALSWTVKCIADDQIAQQKLRAALRDAYPAACRESRQPTVAEIVNTSVPYLDAVIDESLRCNSPLPLVVREAKMDTTVLGRKIPKGTQIFFLTSGPDFKAPSFHVDDATRSQSSREKRRAGRWNTEDIGLFKPERWLKQDEEGHTIHDTQAGPMLAFGSGPRGCFGKRLAYMEMRMVLALLVWNFNFDKLGEPFGSYEAYDSITAMPKYCYVALEKLK